MPSSTSSSDDDATPLHSPEEPDPTPSNNDEGGESSELALEELLYSSASFYAIVKPVTLTMILSALAVVYINTDETIEEGEQALSVYQTFDTADYSDSNAETLGVSLLNALIIVSVVCCMTFVIVLLYKYRCMCFLTSYMVLSFGTLLGLMGGVLWDVAIQKYQLAVDQFSFYFALYNFAIVGAAAIFFQSGIPGFITQGYLIATSVILAWQLSHFDDWTSWTLLIMLALYDLCAVLTPCGPLKALVNLMSQDDAPDMPGLLYEAELPAEARRPTTRRRPRNTAQQQQAHAASSAERQERERCGAVTSTNTRSTSSNDDTNEALVCATAQYTSDGNTSPTTQRRMAQQLSHLSTGVTTATSTSSGSDASTTNIRMTGSGETVESVVSEETEEVVQSATTCTASVMVRDETMSTPTPPSSSPPNHHHHHPPPPTGPVPFAIAKIYRLSLVQEEPRRRDSWEPLLSDGQQQEQLSPNEQLALQYRPEELCREVEAVFPRGGGRIDKVVGRRSSGVRYHVKDRQGVVKRVLFVDEQGRVMQETQADEDDDDDHRKDNSIKLGLGDFIFYSVLVSKAAQYSFTTFITCMLVILAGLGGTLVLLAVYQQALPALPISIFLGVIFYLLTRSLIEPWIENLFLVPYYV